MDDSDSSDGETADVFGTVDRRNHEDGRRHFQRKPQFGEPLAHQRGGGRGRGRNFDRSRYDTRRTNNLSNSRHPQNDRHVARDGSTDQGFDDDNRCKISFDSECLETLSEMNSNDILTTLMKQKMEFENFLTGTITSDVLVLTLRVLVNLCRGDYTEMVPNILSHACSKRFLENLESFMRSLCFEKESDTMKQNKLYWNNRTEFWDNVVEIFQKMIDLLPSKARDELIPILSKMDNIVMTIETTQDYLIGEKVKKSAGDMLEELQEQLKKFETKTVNCEPIFEKFEDEPPENFRSLSIIPTKQDLLESYSFIRANKISEAYNSVEHYLDVQFRLLREDFLSPLRDGLLEYLGNPDQYRNSNFRIYRRVRFVFEQIVKRQSGSTVFFGTKKHTNWTDSKRLMFGTLLCLSKDNFNTVLFATVTNSDEFSLRKGLLVIKSCDETPITEDFFNNDFVMLESKLYFEPYFVVLNTMRHMYEENFPMKNYLVDADTTTVLPSYLNAIGDEKDKVLIYKGFRIPIAPSKEWPSPETLGLDEMQCQAFKCALTQELAVIQGPPGTGKTFLALQIIATMLQNEQHWRSHGPIIIVCLTNHALDQFLEGILLHTSSIVRIGTRSKNEKLYKYSLKNRLEASRLHPERELYDSDDEYWDSSFGYYEKPYKKRRYLRPTPIQRYMYDVRNDVDYNVAEIKRIYKLIDKLTQENAIVPLWQLQECCGRRIFQDWLLEADFTSNIADNENAKHVADELEPTWQFELFHQFTRETDSDDQVLLPLNTIDGLINEIEAQINLYRQSTQMHELPFDPTKEWEHDISELQILRFSLQQNLAQHPLRNNQNQGRHQDPQWEAYWRLITLSYESVMGQLADLQRQSNYSAQRLIRAKQRVDLEELEKYDVIGLTTTAAARLHDSLVSLHAPIVLVEEAAEILEAQVVCSLTKSCQHLILIGDHKQLRPKPAVYELGTKYNLNISLFERMVNIGGNHTQLANQHRMRPEIAKLISPSIYETLHNDKSVCEYPSVKGLKKNVFFLHHTHEEVASEYNEDSWGNPHEAEFLVALAGHLIYQGYSSSEITILCTYAGQLSSLTQQRDRYKLSLDLRITTVDNYQGEENKIILLSLVRNNKEGIIGFLKEENRVCVALSRAREGLYIMGNMDILTKKNKIWPKVKKALEENDEIGDSLELRCEIHAEELIKAQNAMDFKKSPLGGCLKKCNTEMPCGHICPNECHSFDREHKSFNCRQPCERICPRNGHPCPLECWQYCESCLVIADQVLECGHTVPIHCGEPATFPCPVMVDAILPECNHAVVKPCYKSVTNYPCPNLCNIELSCGHTCKLNCHVKEESDHLKYVCKKDCTKNNLGCTMDHHCTKRCGEKCTLCDINCRKKRSCGHYFDCECSLNVETIVCTKPCKRQMDCGHTCQLKCNQVCGECQEEVEKTSSCGHKIKVKCNEEATPSKCSSNCQRNLSCGHPCASKCKDPCITTCRTMTIQTEPGLCGHIFSVPCYMQKSDDPRQLLKYCKEPCKAKLTCGHICKGNCGLCNQGRIHVPCGEICGKVLVCGHKCEVPCCQKCPPCKKICGVECQHTRCIRKCTEPCAPCKETCNRRCPHSSCNKQCFELCDRDPCTEPCLEILKCGHPCIGFCGELCPQLCRICNKEELMEELLVGDDSDARFVLLEDCGHCIESTRLSNRISECSELIQMKTCPRCKTCIRKCLRIMNQIKTDVKDSQFINEKMCIDKIQLQNKKQLLIKEMELMATNPVLEIFSSLRNFFDTLQAKVHAVPKNKRKPILDARGTDATKITLNIFQLILKKLDIIDRNVQIPTWLQDQIAMLVQLLSVRGEISNQEIVDIELEIQRLHYMAEVCKMDLEAILKNCDSEEHKISWATVIDKLRSIEKFSETKEQDIKNEIFHLTLSIGMKPSVTTGADREMILKTVGFKRGDWIKCFNTHIFPLTNYGGAKSKSNRCPECGVTGGGESHQSRSNDDDTMTKDVNETTAPA